MNADQLNIWFEQIELAHSKGKLPSYLYSGAVDAKNELQKQWRQVGILRATIRYSPISSSEECLHEALSRGLADYEASICEPLSSTRQPRYWQTITLEKSGVPSDVNTAKTIQSKQWSWCQECKQLGRISGQLTLASKGVMQTRQASLYVPIKMSGEPTLAEADIKEMRWRCGKCAVAENGVHEWIWDDMPVFLRIDLDELDAHNQA